MAGRFNRVEEEEVEGVEEEEEEEVEEEEEGGSIEAGITITIMADRARAAPTLRPRALSDRQHPRHPPLLHRPQL